MYFFVKKFAFFLHKFAKFAREKMVFLEILKNAKKCDLGRENRLRYRRERASERSQVQVHTRRRRQRQLCIRDRSCIRTRICTRRLGKHSSACITASCHLLSSSFASCRLFWKMKAQFSKFCQNFAKF